jgi:hypothetical protein
MGSEQKTSGNNCALCGAKVNGSAMFCSDECNERHYDYVLVDIPRRWVDNTLRRLSCPERYTAIVQYSKRHSFDLQLVKKKLVEKYEIDICRRYR